MSKFNSGPSSASQFNSNEFDCEKISTNHITVKSSLNVYDKHRAQYLDFNFKSKGEPGNVFINENNLSTTFVNVNSLLPHLDNIDKNSNDVQTTFNQDIFCKNIIVENLNLKTYIDQRIEFILSTLGEKINYLTSP